MREKEPFQYLGKFNDFEKLLKVVNDFNELDWKKYKKRNSGIAAEYSDTIPLIYDPKLNINSNIKHENYDKCEDLLFGLLKVASSKFEDLTIKQAMFARLACGVEIKRHKDVGPITQKTHRIHVPVITNEKCIFTIENESRNMKAGEVWLIDNTDRYHSVVNNGNCDRVHLIVDVI